MRTIPNSCNTLFPSMKRILVACFLILFTFSGWAGLSVLKAQSKTEKAKEKADKKKESGGSDGSSPWWVEWIIEPLLIEGGSYLLYIDKSTVPRMGPMSYNPRPFESNVNPYRTRGIRDWETMKTGMLQVEVDYTHGYMSSWLTQYGLEAKQHLGYWAFQGSYRSWQEDAAPFALNTWHVGIERKLLFFPSGDAGVSMGFQQVNIGSSRYNGFDIGYNMELYLMKPLSIKYEVHGISYSQFSSTSSLYSLRGHWQNAYISLGYRRFNFDGSIFDGFRFGFGMMF